MSYSFHPQAATEYTEQVAFYKSLNIELGTRFHNAVKTVIAHASENPARYPIESPPSIRRAMISGFPYNIIFRELNGNIQILAVAHHRRRPLYWLNRC